MSLHERYQDQLRASSLKADPEQERAVIALQSLLASIESKNSQGILQSILSVFKAPPSTKQGVYLHGGVGRGKSMLMDMFFDCVPTYYKKRRVHFHAFMIETHDWLHKVRGDNMDDLLPSYAQHVADHAAILCFDEFHVTDVADAMILGRLFTALLDKGVYVIATSNWEPERLYEGGLQRELFLPFIALLQDRLEVVHLDSPTDYRLQGLSNEDKYLWPLGEPTHRQMDALFRSVSGGTEPENDSLSVKGRTINIDAANDVARASFAQLCERPHGAEDYLALAQRYQTIFIENIPKIGYDRRNEAKRFMTLIDVLYDSGTQVFISADAPADKLYIGKDHAFEFDRTVSRLIELQQ